MITPPRRTPRGRGALVCGLSVALAAALSLPAGRAFARDGASSTACAPAGRGAKAAVPENFHARLDAAFAGELARKGSPIRRLEVSGAERAAEASLAARVPGLLVERDEASLLPVMVMSGLPGGRLSRPAGKAGATAEEVARGFLAANKALYGVSEADLGGLVARYVTAPEGGATIVKFDQYAGGVQLFDTELAVALSGDLEVVAASGRIYPGAAAVSRTTPTLAPEAAIARAVRDLTGREVEGLDFAFAGDLEGGYKRFDYAPDRASAPGERFLGEHVRAKAVLFPLAADRFVPGYYLELWVQGEPAGSGPVFSYVVGEDGAVLFRNNLTAHESYTYRVYADTTGILRPWDGPTGTVGTPHPTGVPDGYQAPFTTANMVTVESLIGASDPWLPPAATVTTGNNTDAYLDLGGGDGFHAANDIRGAVSSPGVFDYAYNSSLQASDATNRQAAVVGMFYQVNWLHDIWYRHGFTEAAGNAQASNYGRGGAENDSLRAEGQDSSGSDNANMSTPADGGRPRMQMYTFQAGGRLNPTRDGTFDLLIVGHEMGHYITNRLIGNSNGLTNNQGRSMGEGWGDFFAILTTSQPGDDLDGVYAVGGQTDIYLCNSSFVDNYYYSIRRYPYSSRKDRSPFTFKDIGSGITLYPGVSGNPCSSLTGSPSAIHNSGEIWANALWEAYVGLAKAYGQQVGHDKIMQYVVDGLKLTPTQPTFTLARNGVIAAASAANAYSNPKDAQILWQAFAKRGMGTNAVSPAPTSGTHAGVVEDFTAAPALPDDTIGLYINNSFFERNVHFGGIADTAFPYGLGALVPLAGNWDGGAGVGAAAADNPGLYDPATGFFFLRNSNTGGAADTLVSFGVGGAAIPLEGDWDGDGVDTVGLYDPVSGFFFLRNSNTPGPADLLVSFGPQNSTLLPIAGDWDANGVDNLGLYDVATGAVFLKNSNTDGPADAVYFFGGGGDFRPIAGDWDGDGHDTIGIYSPSLGVFYLRNAHDSGPAHETISFGPTNAGAMPVAGNFDGQ